MKISEMTTDQAADVLVRIADPAANIMHDKKVVDMLEQMATGKDVSPFKFIADNLGAVVAVLVGDHRGDLYEVVAALSGKTVKDVAAQKFTETVKDIRESWDGDLVDFFGSSK